MQFFCLRFLKSIDVMTDLLDSYEQEFQELTFAVSQRIQQIPKLTGGIGARFIVFTDDA